MSHKVEGRVHKMVLPSVPKSVLRAMAYYAQDDGTRVFPSVALLISDTGHSERQVHRAIATLRGLGLIVPYGVVDRNNVVVEMDSPVCGRGQVIAYRICLEKGAKTDDKRVPKITEKGAKTDDKRVPKITEKGAKTEVPYKDAGASDTLSGEPLRDSLTNQPAREAPADRTWLVGRLKDFQVTEFKAEQLVDDFDAAHIREMLASAPFRRGDDPAALLVASIEHGWAVADEVVEQRKREAQEAERRREYAANLERDRAARAVADADFARRLEATTPRQREELERRARDAVLATRAGRQMRDGPGRRSLIEREFRRLVMGEQSCKVG